MNPALKQDIYVSTIIDSHNYGTVLQAVATRDVFEHYGHPVFIDYCRPHWTTKGWIKSYMGNTNRNVPERLARLVANAPVRHKSSTLFRSFVERELELCSPAPYLAHGGGLDSNAVYCVGSDQTWNIECNYGIDPVYFLKNVPGNYKKIAFSASFGRPDLSAEEIALTKPLLSQFGYARARVWRFWKEWVLAARPSRTLCCSADRSFGASSRRAFPLQRTVMCLFTCSTTILTCARLPEISLSARGCPPAS